MIQLNLTRPIAFFDLETTGINVGSDRIVEISILKISTDGTKQTFTKRINPTIPIPKQASEVHGIYDLDVANEPTFKSIAKEISAFLLDCDLAGYNSNKFDIPILVEEFLRVDVDFDINKRRFVDVQNIFHQMEQRTLKAAYKFYCGKDIINAHSAEADIEALHNFTNINKNVDLAGRIIFNDKGIEVFNFGKHIGKPVEKVLQEEPSYYSWMMNGDFPLYTKKILTDIKLRSAFKS